MRIATKITLAVSTWTALLLVVDGFVKLEESISLLREDLFDESVLAVNLLRYNVDQAALEGGPIGAQQVLSRINVSPDDLHFHLVELRPDSHFPPAPPLSALAEPAAAAGANPFYVVHADPSDRLYSYVAVPLLGPAWRVEVSASLGAQAALTQRFWRDTAALVALITGVTAFLAGWIGSVHISQRVSELSRLAEETGQGLEPRHVPDLGDDELSALTRDLNRMVDHLAEMRRRTDDEAALRSRLREQLRHADRLGAIGMMMSRVAHEIGTPLNVISARVRKIARGQVEGDAARENARIAAEQTERIALVIRRMLDFSRREGARGPAEARGLAETSIAMVEALARSNDQRLILDDRSGGAEVWVEPVLIEQALVNLLINAISASPAGGEIRLQISVLEEPGASPTAPAVPRLCFAVEDEGPGVPAELAAQVFDL